MAKAQRIDFDDLKARSDFRAVLLHYGLIVVGSGDQAKVLCPFHDDERPSCSVNLTKGLWHCFRGCGAGNVLDFVHRMENRDGGSVKLLEAARRLADICGLGSGKPAPGRQEPRRASTAEETAFHRPVAETGLLHVRNGIERPLRTEPSQWHPTSRSASGSPSSRITRT